MKKTAAIIFIAALLAFVSGCAATHTTVTLNRDGSFDLSARYEMQKSAVAGDAAFESLTEIITQQFEQAGVDYELYETDSAQGIEAKKRFADYEEFVNPDNWKGFFYIPMFVGWDNPDALKLTYHGGVYTFSGNINAQTLRIGNMSSQSDALEAFSAELTIVLPQSAGSANADETDAAKHSYTWRATGADDVPVNLVYSEGFWPGLFYWYNRSFIGAHPWLGAVLLALLLVLVFLIMSLVHGKSKKTWRREERDPAENESVADTDVSETPQVQEDAEESAFSGIGGSAGEGSETAGDSPENAEDE